MALDKIRTELIADDAVTAAKIPTGAIGTTEIAEGALSVHALQNTTSHTLSGTYTDSKMYTSDAYVLGGDITVNSNLVLSSVKGDDSDITLTDDGTTRTITGTGKLEGGALIPKREDSVTGMTGELGSVITGSPALNLSNATSFPIGHVIQTQFTQYEGFGHMTGMGSHQNVPLIIIESGSAATSLATTGILQVAITPKANSKIKLECQWFGEYNAASVHDAMWTIVRSKGSTHTRLGNNTTSNSSTTNGFRGIQVASLSYHEAHVGSTPESVSFTYFDANHTGNGAEEIIYKLAIVTGTNAITDIHTNRVQQSDYYNQEMGISNIIATEIAGAD